MVFIVNHFAKQTIINTHRCTFMLGDTHTHTQRTKLYNVYAHKHSLVKVKELLNGSVFGDAPSSQDLLQNVSGGFPLHNGLAARAKYKHLLAVTVGKSPVCFYCLGCLACKHRPTPSCRGRCDGFISPCVRRKRTGGDLKTTRGMFVDLWGCNHLDPSLSGTSTGLPDDHSVQRQEDRPVLNEP